MKLSGSVPTVRELHCLANGRAIPSAIRFIVGQAGEFLARSGRSVCPVCRAYLSVCPTVESWGPFKLYASRPLGASGHETAHSPTSSSGPTCGS